MLNQTILVGRLAKEIKINKKENGEKVATITLAVPRSFKNENGEYDTDFIECILNGNIAENTAEYCKQGDVIGVKGRIETNIIEQANSVVKYEIKVVAEKVTFLSSRSPEPKEDEQEELEEQDEIEEQTEELEEK